MAIATIIVLALFAHKGIKHAKASPILEERSNRPSTSFTVQVPITAQNQIYDIVHVDTNIDAVHYAQDMDTWDNPSYSERIIKNITISKTYDIHAQLCVPPNGSKKSYLQLATHGGGFDSRYWDSEVEPKKHSYVARRRCQSRGRIGQQEDLLLYVDIVFVLRDAKKQWME